MLIVNAGTVVGEPGAAPDLAREVGTVAGLARVARRSPRRPRPPAGPSARAPRAPRGRPSSAARRGRERTAEVADRRAHAAGEKDRGFAHRRPLALRRHGCAAPARLRCTARLTGLLRLVRATAVFLRSAVRRSAFLSRPVAGFTVTRVLPRTRLALARVRAFAAPRLLHRALLHGALLRLVARLVHQRLTALRALHTGLRIAARRGALSSSNATASCSSTDSLDRRLAEHHDPPVGIAAARRRRRSPRSPAPSRTCSPRLRTPIHRRVEIVGLDGPGDRLIGVRAGGC